MMEHVLTLLQAYHDGELQDRQVRRVEAHLAECEHCRAELDAIRAFSSLLQESPAADSLLRPDQFVAQVGLQLPRRPEQTTTRRVLEVGWRLIPVGLFGAWAFVQTVFIVVAGILWAQDLPITATLFSSVLPPVSAKPWLSGLQCFEGVNLNNFLDAVWCAFRMLGPLGTPIILGTIVLVGIGLLYWSWLASWWIRRRKQLAGI